SRGPCASPMARASPSNRGLSVFSRRHSAARARRSRVSARAAAGANSSQNHSIFRTHSFSPLGADCCTLQLSSVETAERGERGVRFDGAPRALLTRHGGSTCHPFETVLGFSPPSLPRRRRSA